MSEAKKQYRVYNGGEPYGFISYAHKDAARVLPVIAALSWDRFRLWYDAGIEAGDNWPEVVADHLRTARPAACSGPDPAGWGSPAGRCSRSSRRF